MIVEGYPSDQGRPLDGFLEGEMASLEKSISCGSPGSREHKILIMSAQFSVHSLFTRVQVCGPQRPDRIAAWLRLGYPGRPRITMTALAYNPLYACTGVS
ncbi:hypothetical protein ES703_44935 [subsurface metagenome]